MKTEKETNELVFESYLTDVPTTTSELQSKVDEYAQMSVQEQNAILIVETKLMHRKIMRVQRVVSIVFNLTLIGVALGVTWLFIKNFA